MTTATLIRRPVARPAWRPVTTSCVACFGAIDGPSDTGLFCSACACHRCGEDATGSDALGGYCAHCVATLELEGLFGSEDHEPPRAASGA